MATTITFSHTHKTCENTLISEGYLPNRKGEGWVKEGYMAFIACSNNYGRQRKRNFMVVRINMS